MSLIVCSGAMCKCTFGTAPSTLMVTPDKKCLAQGPVATISDNVAMKNIMPFGMCTSMTNPTVASATAAALGVLTPQPCMPMIAAPWMPGSAKVLITGIKALTADSQVQCIYGGTISVSNAGQNKVNA